MKLRPIRPEWPQHLGYPVRFESRCSICRLQDSAQRTTIEREFLFTTGNTSSVRKRIKIEFDLDLRSRTIETHCLEHIELQSACEWNRKPIFDILITRFKDRFTVE